MEPLSEDQRHELRGPVTAIQGFSELLAASELSEEQKSMLEKIQTSVDKLRQLIDTE
ncbi:MAG: histidine kinase dimerization/phospho-acceptor domain-containing protein [Patescibacteria group bacterium]